MKFNHHSYFLSEKSLDKIDLAPVCCQVEHLGFQSLVFGKCISCKGKHFSCFFYFLRASFNSDDMRIANNIHLQLQAILLRHPAPSSNSVLANEFCHDCWRKSYDVLSKIYSCLVRFCFQSSLNIRFNVYSPSTWRCFYDS